MPGSYTKSWTPFYNNSYNSSSVLAQAQSIMYGLKNAYSQSNWRILGSANGVTGAMDGVDRISSSNDFSWNSNTGSHSWFVVQSPTGSSGSMPNSSSVTLCYSTSTGQANPHLYSLRVLSSASFTGGSHLGDPTASAGGFKIFASKQFMLSASSAGFYHYCYSNLGDILFHVSHAGTGWCLSSTGFATSRYFENGDNYPCIVFSSFSNTTPGALTNANLSSTTHAIQFWINGEIDTSHLGTGTTTAGLMSFTTPGGALGIMDDFDSAGSDISGLFPDLPAIVYWRVTGRVALRGIVTDISRAPSASSIIQGTVTPATGTATHAIIGEYWVPCSGQVPII